ncbi:MAG: hypothetical protein AAEJ04_06940 [Planctomycetota bacterium]
MECPPHATDKSVSRFPPLPSTARSVAELLILQPVPLATFPTDQPVPIPLYLKLDGDTVLCRRPGEIFDAVLRRHILESGKDRLWTPAAVRPQYLQHLQSLVLGHLRQQGGGADDPLSLLAPWLDSIQHVNPQVLERAWRTAFYGLHLAEGAGLAGSTLCQQVVLGLLLHEIEVEQMPGGCAASIIEGYRERIDGQGPLRWGPEKLTLPVRIACVAVAFDRKTSGADEEPRQPAFDVLRDFIAKDHGALDPRIIAGFIRILDR